MSSTKDFRESSDGRSENKSLSEEGVWTFEVRDYLKLDEKRDSRKVKRDEGRRKNTGLPLNLFENHSPWSAYVTYVSPVVKRLIENSKARELEYIYALEKNRLRSRKIKLSNKLRVKKKKSTKTSVNKLKDSKSKTTSSLWNTPHVSARNPPAIPESSKFPMDSRDGPTANYNKIIFCQKPMMRMLPYSSL